MSLSAYAFYELADVHHHDEDGNAEQQAIIKKYSCDAETMELMCELFKLVHICI